MLKSMINPDSSGKKIRLTLGIIPIMLLVLSTGLMAQTSTPPSNYTTSTGLSGDPYFISSIDNLSWLSQNSGDWDKYYEQTADIDATVTASWNSGAGFSPIGNSTIKFTGSYDGNEYFIDNLYIYCPSNYENDIGLFGYISETIIQNIGVTNVDITGYSNVGALVGTNDNSTISNCYTSGSLNGNAYCHGGLVGANNYSIINNSSSTVNVTGYSKVGGLVGFNCNQSTISKCYSTGNVIGHDSVGGLVGYSQNDTAIINCYNRGNVTRNSGTYTAFGGFCGFNYFADIEYCYSTGKVYSAPGVNWNEGDNADKGFVGTEVIGTNSYTSNFFDSTASNQSTGTGATAETTTNMKIQSTFTSAGWDFSTPIWILDSGINNGYPYLNDNPPVFTDDSYIFLQVEYNDGTPCDLPTEMDTCYGVNFEAESDTCFWSDEELQAYNDTIEINYSSLGWNDGDSIYIFVRADSDGTGGQHAQQNSYINTIDTTGTNNQYWTFSGEGGLTLQITVTPPENVIITIDGDDIKLDWDDIGADNYYIYRSIYPYTTDWGEPIDSTTVNTYTDENAALDIKYFYRITAGFEN